MEQKLIHGTDITHYKDNLLQSLELSLENIQVENTKGSNGNMFSPIFSDEVL